MFGERQPALAEQLPAIGCLPAIVIIDCSKPEQSSCQAVIMPKAFETSGIVGDGNFSPRASTV